VHFFLSSIAYAFLRLFDCYHGLVTHQHCNEYVCFNIRKINGATLIVGIMEMMTLESWKKDVHATLLSQTPGSFYQLLSEVKRELKGGKTNMASMNPRWQLVYGHCAFIRSVCGFIVPHSAEKG
jgi:hypothetical protein